MPPAEFSLPLPTGRDFPLKLFLLQRGSPPAGRHSTTGSLLRRGGSFSPVAWLIFSVHVARGLRYMH